MIHLKTAAVMFLIPLGTAVKALGLTSGISSVTGYIFAHVMRRRGNYGNPPHPLPPGTGRPDSPERDEIRSWEGESK